MLGVRVTGQLPINQQTSNKTQPRQDATLRDEQVTPEDSSADPEALAHKAKLQPGTWRPEQMPCQAPKITEILKTAALHETFWHKRLRAYQSIQLPYEVWQGQPSMQRTTSAWCELLPYGADDQRHTALTAFAIYLARLTGQTRLQVGWHLQKEQGAIISSSTLASTVPMELDVDWSGSFLDVLEQIKEELKRLTQHDVFAWDWVSSEPALQKISELQAANPWRIGVSMIGDLANEEAVGSVLTFQIGSHGQFRWLYDSQCLDAEVVERMSEHLQEIVKAAKNTYQKPVKQLNLLPRAERKLLLKTWNLTKAPYPDKVCFHQLFEKQVKRSPEAIALVYEDQELSYAELNARANRLAHRLIELGVSPEKRVAICVARSPAAVVGLLGILKAGGAYVPLDPAYSSERLTHILTDAAPTILLADEAGRTVLGEAVLSSITVLDPNELPELAITNPHIPGLSSSHLAYVIYTSGSTGTPKGVMVEHRSVVNLAQAQQVYFGMGPSSRVLQFISLSFDASIGEIFTALRCGASLYLPLESARRDRNGLWDYFAKHAITHAAFPPALLQGDEDFTNLKIPLTLILGGEKPSLALLKNLARQGAVFNAYGPTEATVCAAAWRCPHHFNGKAAPIGRPLKNTQLYVLDANGQPVPLGAVGELYIGGAGVARGYLNRPELTAERFLLDPFSDDKNARMYKTGDLVRYFPDGNLEFLGRNDHQIKIRGFRIESGEIEARLIEHPQVREAVVLALGEASDKRLVAYVAAEADKQLASTLRAHLATKLPDYMMPAAFVRLDALPLNPNGKLDRRALPEPDNEAFARQIYEAPQGQIEIALATIWSDLLKVERISRHDNFFALGGNSLLALRIIERLRRLSLTVSVRALFDKPTLKRLAQSLGQHLTVATPPNLITTDTTALTPAMLPLIDLSQADIDRIVEQTPGGVSNIQDIYALSPLQDGILFHHLLAAKGDPYILTIDLAFGNRTLLNRYLDAFQQVVKRHDILRTAFIWEGLSKPAQVVLRRASLSITELSLDPAHGPIAKQLMQRFDPSHYRLDLTQAPLLHFAIAQDTDGRWRLVQLLHHLIGDHVALDRVQMEVQAFLQDRGDTLPPPQPFRNLVARARLGVSQEAHERFFTEMLAEIDEPTLPFGVKEVLRNDTPVTQSHRMLPQDLNDRLRAHARRLGVSLASLCHLAWAQVLARTSGQQRVVFGTVLFGRMQAGEGADHALGLFINTLPLRIDLDHRSVQDSVRQTQTQLAALLEHEHASLVLAQRCSGVQAGTPLFSALLNYVHHTPLSESLTEPGIEFVGERERTNYPFVLSVEDSGHALGLIAQAVEQHDPVRMCGYMQQGLQSLVEALEHAPDMPVCQLEVLPTAERELLLNTWNATKLDYPKHLCVHQLFEAQVEHTPEAIALVYENQILSYAELNARANRLAYQLIELGVGPDRRVAICVARSPAMVVGLLGILKAGGVYVPLDPAYSSERLTYILTDAAPAILLADVVGRTALGETALASLTVLDPNKLPKSTIANPMVSTLRSNHQAYVIYTSGSTGMPKGVMVEHRSVVNLAQAQQVYFEIGPSSRVLQFASPSFDASIWEAIMALSCGASLALLPDTARHDLSKLWDYLERYAITHATLPPALLQDGTTLPRLKIPLTLILAGEAPSANLLKNLVHARAIFNAYGPTEATVCATAWRCPPNFNGEVIPVGRPLINTQLYVLGANGQPVPVGAVGELYIGGAGVARGYLNRPDLTAERFSLNLFSEDENARVYKTGDLARYLPDGNLEFLGRNDYQIKIRGFRVEPGEIEARLIEHSQVREAAVLAVGEGSEKRLVAYVVAEADEQLAFTLRMHLTAKLPDYMLPAAFVHLDALPMTPNGKLDRRALPAPSSEAFARQTYEAPQGEIETTLANIWAELLKVKQVSRHDSFFALGGHSLLAVQMIEHLRRLGLTVSVRALFDKPTLNALAQSLGKHCEVITPPNLITADTTTLTPTMLPLIDLSQADIDRIIEQTPGGVSNIQDIYALSPLQDGILFHHLLAAQGDPYILITELAFDNRALLNRYLDAVQRVVKRHDILRTAFIWEHLSTPAQVVWRHALLSITELSLDPADGPIAEQLLHRFDPRQHRIDLTQAPLLRFVIAQETDGRWLLVQLMHHLIGDHSTTEVMDAEVKTFIGGQSNTLLPPQPFRNLVAQTRVGMSQEAHEHFFSDMLVEVDEPTLPFGLTEVHRDGSQVTESHRMLPQDLNDRLRAQAKRLGVSLASLCHLTWAQVLARTSGQQRVVFGTVLLGRMQGGAGADRAMGLFINTLPLRVDLDEKGVEESVRDTHKRLAALLEHEHASLALAQRCSSVPAGMPLFSSLLNYRHNTVSINESRTMPGIELLSEEERTNYPFTLSVEDFSASLGLTAQAVQPFDPARLCSYMQQTLQSLAEALERTPDMPVRQLEVLPLEERELLLQTWNATEKPYPENQCIHQLFEEQVERAPKATALVYEDQVLSYAELNARANRLAHRLIELGVGPDGRVAICVQRSPAMILGLLGILKAGGVYVPLDPTYSSERLTQIFADAAPAVLLADVAGHAALGKAVPPSITVLDPNELLESAITNPDVLGLSSSHLAYVIYTSGSTGTPKGVTVKHQSVVNLAQAHPSYFEIGSSSRVLQFASPGFDASIWEIVMALSCGASLSLPSDTARHDLSKLWDYLEKYAITHAILPPALLQDGTTIPRLQPPLTLILGGEAPSATLLKNLIHRNVIFNAYGPTEATVCATAWRCPPNFNGEVIPIGRPLANTQLYVLDSRGQPVPLGAAGELYIGGVGVANGYLNRPELTAGSFVPDPFSKNRNAWMYKTGDLARYLPDGNLEFLGRNDHQIKIRGFRIEPGEIEARLIEHPQVRESAVLALGEGSDKHLVAYVVAEADEQLASTLRAHLTARLPGYMLPAAFVRLDTLPLNPNGKLDRRALPAPDERAFARQAYEAPQGEIETVLANIWAELLKVERVSRHDSFLALGGHSLLAVRLMNRIRSLGVELPLAVLFSSSSLSAFAAAVSEHLSQRESALPIIMPVSRESVLPLSFAQQRLWFIKQLDQDSNTYNIPLAIRLRGALDRTAWQRALDTVFARHEALRSVFVTVDGQPQIQLLAPELRLPMRYQNLRGEPDAQKQSERLSHEEAYAPFDLEQGPLIRARLIQLADKEHVFLLTQHHIVSDGWSLNVLQRELEALYIAYRAEDSDPLPPLAIQYPDYAAWQRQWLSEDRLKTQSEYWRTTLADAPVLLSLPTDRPRPAQQSFAGDHVPVRLDAQTTSALKRLSQEHGATLFVSLLAAWGAVLSRLSGQNDLIIGTPTANRNHAEIESLIGFFINTLALRLDLSGAPNTVELLERIRRSTLAAQAHQDLPFEQVVEIVQPPRRLAHTPLFQVMFAWQNNERDDWHLPDLEAAPVALNYDVVKFDLELELQEVGDEIIGELRYATALFDRQTIERQVGYLYAMLRAMVSDAKQCIAEVDILAPAERKLLVETRNATERDYPKHQCVHQLFEAQIERTPEAIALVYEDQALSYAELNSRANQLAAQLTELGVQAGDFIATLLERSIELVTAQLAILKLGAVYVPIDPKAPVERQSWILSDCAARLLITRVETELPAALSIPILRLTPNSSWQALTSIANPKPIRFSFDTAYVMYTSGSTGTPKGVLVPHRAIARLVINNGYTDIRAEDRVAFAANPAFDASTFEVWAPLLNGGRIVIIDSDTFTDPHRLADALTRHKITTLFLTTVLFNQFVSTISPALAQLKYLLCGGEQENLESFTTLLRQGGPSHLIHCYGPTESTTFATTHEVIQINEQLDRLPIGRPIANTVLYLLDALGQPVPLGAVGELYIGGAGVANGYLNRPELTAERFVSDPFSKNKNARMYKTGDLARYLPDSNLEFLGRNDHQVKIRGFRIEPGEIEARLALHPQVHEVVVLALGEGSDKRLVAYVVAEQDERLAHNLRTHLAARLPEYMVPAAFVRFDAFPLTPNGKLDRKALPIPAEEAFARQAYEAPQGEIENTLAAIWSELLGVERISRHDNFFSLGGHSLLAVQMIERLRRLGLALSVRALFNTPSLSVLAQSSGQHQEIVVPSNLITSDTPELTPDLLPLIQLTQTDVDRIVEQTPGGVANIQDIYALSPLQDGILFHHLMARKGDPYLLITQMAFADRALLDRYLDAVQQVVKRHDILRTAFIWKHLSTPAQVVWRHAPLSITEFSLDPADGPIAEQLLHRFDPRRHRIDLTQAPLLRFVIAQETDGRWLLVQLMHHLLGDHAALEVMDTEVRALIKGQGDTLFCPQPFRNLVAQARLGMSQEAHERFFSDMLVEVDEPTLPFGLADVHRDGSQVTQSHRMLSQDLNDRLRAQAKRLSVSLASLCHLAWAQVLARTSGQQRVVFGTVLFGRMQGGAGADRAMGLFINTLPLRIDLDEKGVEESIRSAHTKLAALLEHEHASLALAQRCSSVPAGTPLFSALLNYRHNAVPLNEDRMLSGIELLYGGERTNYPFTLSVEDFSTELGLTAQVAQPFDPARVCGYMQQALQSVVEALERTPKMPVHQLEVLPLEERELLLQTWNATATPYPTHQCIHQLFEEQVERTPESTALVYGDQEVSYAELNARANQLAHQLIELGVQPDTRVAICVERSPAMVVGLLAILKAGGAYVPLDPAYSSDRLTHILIDAAPAILLADAAGCAALGETALTPLTVLDPNSLPLSLTTNPQIPAPTSRHLAYIIYTSGSTGVPKGVMVEHAQITRLFDATADWYQFNQQDVWCLFHSFAFDVSVWELWGALRHGGKLVIVPHHITRSPQDFYRLLCEQGVTVLNQTPSAFKSLIDCQAQSDLRDRLRYVIFAGEALESAVLQKWYATRAEHSPQLVNMYGTTETTVHATYRPMWQKDSSQISSPVGKRIPDLKIYLLDVNRQPVPLGAVGELYIGGAGVARGYLNRPELTNERFLSDPFTDAPDARMYKTGDVVRYLPDGNLEFLGRNDHQIKIRGFRIELGEIEACLAEHLQVREATALAVGEGSDKRLVAYVVAKADEQLAQSLRTHLAARLPEYMVPAAFVRLDAFPLTLNGKLDRKALPAPDAEALARQMYEVPQGEVEHTLAAIWSELLGVERISRHDNFFALGGHSLLAVQLIERLRYVGLTLSVRALFDTPTLSALSQSLGQHEEVVVPPNRITSDTPELTPDLLPLIQLTQADIDHIVEQTPGGVSNVQDIYALSPLQDGILFHHLMASEGDPYLLIAQMVFANRALLDRYLEAIQQVVQRHDILRTAFVWEHLSAPAQVVWRDAPLSITELSLDSKDGPVAEQLLQRFDPRRHRMDLAQAPLLRFAIAQDDNGRWLLVQLMHHLIGDHAALEVMDTEVRALIEGQGDTLPSPQPFRNLVAQASLGVSQEAHERFFSEMLAEVDEPTLPFGLNEVHRDGSQVTESHRALPQDLNDRLRAQAKRLNVSLASLCHLAWAQVLAQTSGQQRVVFGTVLFGRMQGGAGADQVMGLFINTLPLRVDLNEKGVEESVRDTHTRLAALLEHEHASLALAQRCSSVPAGMPLFSALLNYRHNSASIDENQALSGVEWLHAQERTNYPFVLSVEDCSTGLGLTAQVAQPFDPARICGYMQEALQSVVGALERTPKMPVHQLEVLPLEERELLLQTWNATATPYPTHQCIHQLFEEQVERTPESTALVYGDQEVSYAELNARANQLAHQLIELGVQPDTRVAICVERSPAMVVGLLAILKAGGAYVPLDPAYSSDRLTHILIDAAPAILLADAAGCAALGETALTPLTVLDPNSLPLSLTTNPQIPALTSRHLAYIIYTSGSTGVPKGVMVEHAQITRLFDATADWYQFNQQDVWCLFHSFAFDVSVWELWGALRHGGKLVIVPHHITRSPQDFYRLLCEQGVTVLNQTPSAFKSLIDCQAQSDLRDRLRYVIFAGEALESAVLQKWYATRAEHSPQLVNMYGTTETTVHATYRPMWQKDSSQISSPVGKRIPDLKIYLLDVNRQPVPLGAVGELYIGGAGVARGYLNRPELTNERFLSDPFTDAPDARMYKTGDVVRYLPDGNLEFLGRNDHQIKIRGFRIELGEIEACLAEHLQVREATALAVGEGSDKRLVAYVVAKADEQLAQSLRTHLAARLPEYMVPAAFVRLDAFPLTPNGKLDRKALPAPDAEAFARQMYEVPQGEVEHTLAAIWSELLGVERISRHDNFFALGGHSLLAMQMTSRTRSMLGIEITLRMLFEAPTIAGLAQCLFKLDGIQESNSFDVLLPLQPKGDRPPLFCIHPGVGLSWSYIGLSQHLGAEQPTYGLQARGLDGISLPAETFDEMAADYIKQIRRIQPNGPYYLLGWSMGGQIAHCMATQLEQQGERVALLAVLDAYPPLSQLQLGNELDEPQDITSLRALAIEAFGRYSEKNMPDAGEYLWEKTKNFLIKTKQIRKSFSPVIYSGNMLFFRATIKDASIPSLASVNLWKPYILGEIEAHDIHCKHDDMDRPAPTAEISRVLAQKLGELQKQPASESEEVA